MICALPKTGNPGKCGFRDGCAAFARAAFTCAELLLALLACTMAQAQLQKAQSQETKPQVRDSGSATSVMDADHRVTPIDSGVEWRVTAVRPLAASSDDDTQGGGKHPQSSASKWGPVPSAPVPATGSTPEGDAARQEAEERRRRQEPDESLADSTAPDDKSPAEKSPAEKSENARSGSGRKKIRAPEAAAPESASGKESAIRNPLLVERSSLRESSLTTYRSSMHATHPQAKRLHRPAAKSKTSLNAGLNSSMEQPQKALQPLKPALKSQKPVKSSLSDARSSILGTDAH
jgi:hypothetical protein